MNKPVSVTGWISTAEAARICACSIQSVRHWIATGKLRGARAGYHWRVREDDARALAARRQAAEDA